ncbi:hypothetical protein NKG05_13045 [Oerskovia sp. M15]
MSIAHFLVADADTAQAALEAVGIGPVTIHPVIMVKLDQEVPGQLGALTRRLGDSGINILIQYSDHDHSLVIVTDPAHHDEAMSVAAHWTAERQQDQPHLSEARPGPCHGPHDAANQGERRRRALTSCLSRMPAAATTRTMAA